MRASALAAIALLATLGALSGCAVDGPGYTSVDVGYAGDYWEPYGYEYGGWGGRYQVGPPPGGRWRGDEDHRYGGNGGHPAAGHYGAEGGHPSSGHFGGGGRAAPSIPSRPR